MFALGVAALTLNSCEKYFEGVNDNPNQPTDVTVDVLLPSTQVFMAYGNGGDASRFTSLLTQQITGTDRQFAAYQNYNFGRADMDNWWRFNAYAGPFNDLDLIIDKAEANAQYEYAGIARILTAYGIMVTTDLFGDIPFSECFQGVDGLQPAYDSQEEIYNTIFTLLSEARANFGMDPSPMAPGSDDLIYGGDIALWTQFSWLLEARAHIHLHETGGSHAGDALTAVSNAFTSSADDAVLMFGAAATEAGPWSQFMSQRAGDIAISGTMIDWMVANGDPRLALYADTATGEMGPLYGNPASPFNYGTYVEQKFIQAEAAFYTGDLVLAASALNEAVTEHLAQLGVSDATFEANFASETSGSITLEKIMIQKYVAMFTNVEAFSDWRRTGIPALVTNVSGLEIPRRLVYPESEFFFNPNMPTVTVNTRVWWDRP